MGPLILSFAFAIACVGVGGTSAHIKCILSMFVAGRKVIADYEKADTLVRNNTSKVPCVLVRAGHLLDGQETGKYTASYKGFYHIGKKVMRGDVATFLLRTTSSDEHDNKAVQLFT
tara:strand:+ start:211 stop:558 length:348 start_codon:yes stop_codon:yes gene_type:complete